MIRETGLDFVYLLVTRLGFQVLTAHVTNENSTTENWNSRNDVCLRLDNVFLIVLFFAVDVTMVLKKFKCRVGWEVGYFDRYEDLEWTQKTGFMADYYWEHLCEFCPCGQAEGKAAVGTKARLYSWAPSC